MGEWKNFTVAFDFVSKKEDGEKGARRVVHFLILLYKKWRRQGRKGDWFRFQFSLFFRIWENVKVYLSYFGNPFFIHCLIIWSVTNKGIQKEINQNPFSLHFSPISHSWIRKKWEKTEEKKQKERKKRIKRRIYSSGIRKLMEDKKREKNLFSTHFLSSLLLRTKEKWKKKEKKIHIHKVRENHLKMEKLYRWKYEWVIATRLTTTEYSYNLNPYEKGMWLPNKDNSLKIEPCLVRIMFTKTLIPFYLPIIMAAGGVLFSELLMQLLWKICWMGKTPPRVTVWLLSAVWL